MATDLTTYGLTGDGYLTKTYTPPFYQTARDAAVASGISTSINALYAGWYAGKLYRGYLYFDTSSVPAAATITAASVSVYLPPDVDIPGNGHELVLYSGQPTYPSASLAVEDFGRTLYASGGASNIKIWLGQSGLQTFVFNATGLASWITKGGTTKLCIRSEFDVSPTIPGAAMLAPFYTSEKGGGYRPYLTVTYGIKPTVTTGEATSIGSSYATANGTITDNGSDPITDYGAIWNNDGTDPVDMEHADNHAHGSDLAGGVFSASITGLTASTTYLHRDYATNAAGTAYGAAVDFTTSAALPVLTVTTGEPADVGATAVTLRGNLVEDAGDTITQHGFIWKLNSDPYEEADPIHHPTGAAGYVLAARSTGACASLALATCTKRSSRA